MNGIEKLISHFGSQSKTAKHLGVSRQAVSSWVKNRNKLTAERAVEIEKLTGIKRSELRPDLFE